MPRKRLALLAHSIVIPLEQGLRLSSGGQKYAK